MHYSIIRCNSRVCVDHGRTAVCLYQHHMDVSSLTHCSHATMPLRLHRGFGRVGSGSIVHGSEYLCFWMYISTVHDNRWFRPWSRVSDVSVCSWLLHFFGTIIPAKEYIFWIVCFSSAIFKLCFRGSVVVVKYYFQGNYISGHSVPKWVNLKQLGG